ncbi:unnamed protein product [Kuraishia capsulata CBS 1993]|uniref:Coenzyme Q-binding protein COQ10 START domain-containing protein n=1 Tax=Kuraishia capsulata CBS 1993 TaxID=1382522 RepID=W6MVV2_9ASCO|nr:uncharacterized protein KUCA_T00002542001 [Kuraishia capsulata CBS 1993]CDK26570.1 unnamed protein product [Kuraishia capsulata CBS 1993]
MIRCGLSSRVHLITPIRTFGGIASRLRQAAEARSGGSLQSYHVTKKLSYPQELLYDIISGVDKYHEFIPYCTHSFVNARDAEGEPIEAGLDVGFSAFHETFVCKLSCERPEKVKATSITESLFESLDTDWTIKPLSGQGEREVCQVDLVLSYEFKDELYNKTSLFFAKKITKLMLKALEQRAFSMQKEFKERAAASQ